MTLWHYFKIENYRKLVESEALWLSRADKLGDPFEGSVSRATIRTRIEAFEKALPDQRGDHSALVHLGIWDSFGRRMQKLTFVNCWHANEVESAAMWRLYSAQGKGIAVRTTCSKLMRATPKEVSVVEVRYENYAEAAIPDFSPMAPFIFKRKSFAHENEIRVMIQHDPNTSGDLNAGPLGKLMPVPLADLIDDVFVSPESPPDFLEEVMRLTAPLDKPVYRSKIDSPAIF